VFVFTESGGTFTEASEVLPPANTTNAAFAAGSNIGMSADGSTIAFGAPTATAGSAFESGEVFVATETNAGTWALTATDAKPNPVSDDDLGGGDQSVAVAGNGTAIRRRPRRQRPNRPGGGIPGQLIRQHSAGGAATIGGPAQQRANQCHPAQGGPFIMRKSAHGICIYPRDIRCRC
jgi:hypothetical protein